MNEILPSDVDIRQLKELGYILLENVLTPDECDVFIEKLNVAYNTYSPFYDQNSPSVKTFHATDRADIKMVYNLYNKDIAFVRAIAHERVLPYIAFLLQEGSYMNSEPYVLQLSTGRSVGRGSDAQQLHIDSKMPGTPFALAAQALWLLTDFTEDNGATRVVPGSHRRTTFAEDQKVYPDEIKICGKRGSVLVYNGGLWHGSSENRTDIERWAIVNTYTRWFLKPAFNPMRNTPQHIYENLTDFEKGLLGFTSDPPKDEFTRLSRRSATPETPCAYSLPIVGD